MRRAIAALLVVATTLVLSDHAMAGWVYSWAGRESKDTTSTKADAIVGSITKPSTYSLSYPDENHVCAYLNANGGTSNWLQIGWCIGKETIGSYNMIKMYWERRLGTSDPAEMYYVNATLSATQFFRLKYVYSGTYTWWAEYYSGGVYVKAGESTLDSTPLVVQGLAEKAIAYSSETMPTSIQFDSLDIRRSSTWYDWTSSYWNSVESNPPPYYYSVDGDTYQARQS